MASFIINKLQLLLVGIPHWTLEIKRASGGICTAEKRILTVDTYHWENSLDHFAYSLVFWCYSTPELKSYARILRHEVISISHICSRQIVVKGHKKTRERRRKRLMNIFSVFIPPIAWIGGLTVRIVCVSLRRANPAWNSSDPESPVRNW